MTDCRSDTNERDEGLQQRIGDWIRERLDTPRHWLRVLGTRVRGPWIRVGD